MDVPQEIKDLVAMDPAERQAVIEAMAHRADATSIKTLVHLMENAESERIRTDAALGWQASRRALAELRLRLEGKTSGAGVTLNVFAGSNAEVENVRRVRAAFGVQDAEVSDTDAE
jgi:hypothetical protein